MIPFRTKRPRSRKRKWRRRLALGALALLAAAVAVPFVFTGALVRYGLAHSGYRNVPVRFRSASLAVTGFTSLRLTLRDVVIDDPQENGRDSGPLFAAESVNVGFALNELSSNHVRSLLVDNIDVAVRPGVGTPLTLLRLLTPADPAPAAVAAAPASIPFWIDQLVVTGKVRLSGYDPWLALAPVRPGEAFPVQVSLRSAGNAGSPERQVSLIVGEPESAARPSLTTRFTVRPTADGAALAVDELILANVSPVVTDAVKGVLPAALRGGAAGHLDRLVASGTLTLGAQNLVNATAELRDLSGHAGELTLEHFTAGMHVEGRLTDAPLKDLKFTRTHVAWENAQWADWGLQRGTADLGVEGEDVVLSDLQATFADAEFRALGAFDPEAGVVTRGRVWLNNFAAAKALKQLPEGVRRALPVIPEGTLSARVFLSESDAGHMAAHVELVCSDELVVSPPQAAAPTTAVASIPATRSSFAAPGPFAVMTNMDLTGTVSWNFKAALPEVSRGRLTVDELMIAPDWAHRGLQGLPLSKIKSDFDLQGGMARLADFYADVPGNGRITAEAQYLVARRSVENFMLNLNGVDAALANPWLPEGWSAAGQLEVAISGNISAQDLSLQASVGLASQTVLKNKEAALTIAGAAPAITLRGTLNQHTGEAQVQVAEISAIDALQADPGLVKLARAYVSPKAGSGAEAVFEAAKTGAVVSFDKIGFEGPVRLPWAVASAPNPSVAGTLTISGLDVAALADEKAPSLLNLTLKTELFVPLAHPAWDNIRLSEGSFVAQKIALGQNVFAESGGSIAVEKGKAAVTHISVKFAEGTVTGDATMHLPGQLDTLDLAFSGLHQQVLSRAFYPVMVSAEGPISGSVTLNGQTGVISFKADEPGKLKLSREASKSTFAPIARAAAQTPDMVLPSNFEDIIMDQLADYPYIEGSAKLVDSPKGLTIVLDYTRRPLQEGEPGYAVPVTVAGQKVTASLPFSTHGSSITVVDFSIRKLLGQLMGARDSLVGPASRP